ncbi:MAG: DUF423 domain-containing protein [Hyphomonas sp.]|tara:strand:- start:1736 stop:2086 length:351 start_codon:yes stop_codon:yes gene_type:complete
MNRLALAAALTGFLGVALGAFGAHGLHLGADALEWWHTATLYALVHAGASLAIALSGQTGRMRLGGWAFVVGTIIFSGCLYAMAIGAPRWLGAVVPVGGVSFLAGWVLVAVGATRR